MDSLHRDTQEQQSRVIEISPALHIPLRELDFRFSRSSGPGGQHVNKVSTRATLVYDVTNSPSLNPEQRRLILARLATRINKLGQLKVSSYRHRSQSANRIAATERFIELLRGALHKRKPRKKTRVSRAAKERRLKAKKQRSQLKRSRRTRGDE